MGTFDLATKGKITKYEPLDWEIGLKFIIMNCVCIILYPIALVAIEYFKEIVQRKMAYNLFFLYIFRERVALPQYPYNIAKDSDVQEEELRIKSANQRDYSVFSNQLSKTYDKRTLAVYQVSILH